MTHFRRYLFIPLLALALVLPTTCPIIGSCRTTQETAQVQITNLSPASFDTNYLDAFFTSIPAENRSYETAFPVKRSEALSRGITNGVYNLKFTYYGSCGPGDVEFVDLGFLAARPGAPDVTPGDPTLKP